MSLKKALNKTEQVPDEILNQEVQETGPTPEQVPGPEQASEQEVGQEQVQEKMAKVEQKIEAEETQTTGSAPAAQPVAKSEDRQEIEKIMSKGLEELYTELPEDRKEEFKLKGEEAAGKIEVMLKAVKVKVKKIVGLIKNWLMIIPGVNKFFIEQQSKIKADELMEYKKKKGEGEV